MNANFKFQIETLRHEIKFLHFPEQVINFAINTYYNLAVIILSPVRTVAHNNTIGTNSYHRLHNGCYFMYTTNVSFYYINKIYFKTVYTACIYFFYSLQNNKYIENHT